MAPVTGTVKFADGSEADGDVFTIRFVPEGIATEGPHAPKAATGDVKDGKFELTTDTLKGAIVGRYTIEIKFVKKYPGQAQTFIPKPSSVEVVPGSNSFDFSITEPK